MIPSFLSENFLGTPVINRKDEKGKDSRIATMNMGTKEWNYTPVPKFLDFYVVDYLDPPKELDPEVKYKVIEVENAPSRTAALELVRKYKGWLHSYSTVSEQTIIEDSDLETFNEDKHQFLTSAVKEFTKVQDTSKKAMIKLKELFGVVDNLETETIKVEKPVRRSLF